MTVKFNARTGAVSEGPAAAASNAQRRSRILRLALRAQPWSGVCRAFTAVELLFRIATPSIVAVVLPRIAHTGCKTKRVTCGSNQKQIFLAFRTWANDHGEKFPMELISSHAGNREAATQGLPLAGFAMISNELNSPKPLTCPDDLKRKSVPVFAQLTSKNLSYFLGLKASVTNPTSILTGDRNVCVNGSLTNGIVEVRNPSAVAWGSATHKNEGYIGLADGSAHQVTDGLLRNAIQATGLATNSLAIP
ncbi:MAG TPA: hypothetical protein VJ063_21435 [Verrucomicrobiae bacterium]|nr:hypothetical protein [Verrucomicrobiae bacterium]